MDQRTTQKEVPPLKLVQTQLEMVQRQVSLIQSTLKCTDGILKELVETVQILRSQSQSQSQDSGKGKRAKARRESSPEIHVQDLFDRKMRRNWKQEEDLVSTIQLERMKRLQPEAFEIEDNVDCKEELIIAASAMSGVNDVPVRKSRNEWKFFALNEYPTSVLLLRNVVGPGEVDNKLEGEMRSKFDKYGKVTQVLIFEVTEPSVPAEEAVRVFVQFERSRDAIGAYSDLDSWCYGGRKVRASFYDEDKFGKKDLAPSPDEIRGLD